MKPVLITISIILLLSGCSPISQNSQQLQAPGGLICELLRYPEKAIITDSKPEFGWIVMDTKRGAIQTAYQILVASTPEKIKNDIGDFWDSGKVNSDQSINVEYRGMELLPQTSYLWKVRTWNSQNETSPYSTIQQFNTGEFSRQLSWPGESRWVSLNSADTSTLVLENRQHPEFYEINPVSINELSEGHYFIDFGKAAFATLKFTLDNISNDDSIRIFLGEKKTAQNKVDRNPGGSIGCKQAAIHPEKGQREYIVKLPRHISHYPNSQILPEHIYEVAPFRYAEIIGTNLSLNKDSIRQLALFYPFDETASAFNSSNENLNQVWDLCRYTLKATPFLALYCDGNRERMPYEADSYIQQLGHYSVDREYAVARHTAQFLIYNPSWPTEWHLHMVLMAWQDYLQTGNTDFLVANYDELKQKTLLKLALENGLISTRTGLVTKNFLESIHFKGNNFRDIVDWPPGTPTGQKQARNAGPSTAGERDDYVFTDINTVVNAFHYRNLVLMEKIAEVLGKKDDADFYRQRAGLVKESFNSLFFDSAKGYYVDGSDTDHSSLHANMFPLAFEMVPDENLESVTDFIKSREMACSVYGAQYLLEALFNVGESNYALDLITSESKRSWMNMIHTGSTMTTEAWDIYYKPNMTWNHAWGAAPANIIVRKIAGIEPLAPAFQKIKIKPQSGYLNSFEITVPTIRGSVVCKWKQDGSEFSCRVQIPANSSAQLHLPEKNFEEIEENGILIGNHKDLKIIGTEEDFGILEIKSGSYNFSGPISN